MNKFTLRSSFYLAMPLLICLVASITQAEEKDSIVNITSNIAKVEIKTPQSALVIQRIQDSTHTIEPPFDKTSRPCPPFCIQPLTLDPRVQTLGELEVIEFMQTMASTGDGLLIDARMPEWYQRESLPLAVNIPWTEFEQNLPQIMSEHFGARKVNSGWSYANAKTLALYCNGQWNPHSAFAVRKLLALGYPPEKIKWYRGGMQSWKIVGLTTQHP